MYIESIPGSSHRRQQSHMTAWYSEADSTETEMPHHSPQQVGQQTEPAAYEPHTLIGWHGRTSSFPFPRRF